MFFKQSLNLQAKRLFEVLLVLLIHLVFYQYFSQFFPNSQGHLGHDYAYFLPQLVDGYCWYHENGLWEVPWFSPSFGGGLPKFPNPQSMYYSVPQWLSFFISPLRAVFWSSFLFGALGFLGFYTLFTRRFHSQPMAAILAGSLFLFNGFYIHRMAIGHLTYHSFMLWPWLLYLLLGHKQRLLRVTGFSILLAYMFYSGAVLLIPMMVIALIISLGFLYITQLVFIDHKPLITDFIVGIMGALCLSAAYLSASFHFLKWFPRDFYALPGFAPLAHFLYAVAKMLFFKPDEVFNNDLYLNKRVGLGVHEYEYGLTMVPLLILGLFVLFILRNNPRFILKTKSQVGISILLLILFLLPLAFNFYQPWWNIFLKSLPYIGNNSTLIRWVAMYIPLVILFTGLMLSKISWINQYQKYALPLILIVLIQGYWQTDWAFYNTQKYNPKAVEWFYDQVKSEKVSPSITQVASSANFQGHLLQQNDLMTQGISCLEPDESLFGYTLEKFPKKSLHVGGVWEIEKNACYNFKNPASYVFPLENNLMSGDHFTLSEKEFMDQLLQYQPYEFKMSTIQRTANVLTTGSLVLALIILLRGFLSIKKAPSKLEA